MIAVKIPAAAFILMIMSSAIFVKALRVGGDVFKINADRG